MMIERRDFDFGKIKRRVKIDRGGGCEKFMNLMKSENREIISKYFGLR